MLLFTQNTGKCVITDTIPKMEKVLEENQPRKQVGFRKGCSTVDHFQTINQLMEKCNEFNRPLCIGYINYEKAFDSIEDEAIFKA